MSDYIRARILKIIEENGGPKGLDLSGVDLSDIDLSREAIEAEVQKIRGSFSPFELERPFRTWYAGGINLVGANLQGADLRRANLQEAHLGDANLKGVILWYANLQDATLWEANLQEADLIGANLQGALVGYANLQDVTMGGANLQGADLTGANLQRAKLADANLQGADLREANLQEADLSGANLQEATLWGVDLKGAHLGVANLQGANLWRASLQGAYLGYSHLERVDFFAITSLEGAYFYNAFLDDTRLKREQLGEAIGEELGGKYDEAKEAYLALKNNFAEIGRYRDESWAYIKERQMGKMMNHPRLARRYYGEELSENPSARRLAWFYIRHTAKWLTDWFVELLCGYGESLWRVLAWMLLVVLGFAVYYQVSHAVVTSSQDAVTSLWDHLIFSLGAFTTLQPARLQAARPGVELLTTIQAIIGISLAGLLGFVAGNRIRRS
jgi:uncharacterized protein YjbI with pentapeptide repeats